MDGRQSHQAFIDKLEAIRKSQEILYRGYTIEPTLNGCPYEGYDYYPTDEGRDDDADFDGEQFRHCGNVEFTHSIEAAKAEIDAILGPAHIVVMNEGDPVYERRYSFESFEHALEFAIKWGATLYPHGDPILNP